MEVRGDFRNLKDDAVLLNDYYIATRYPGDCPEFSFKECRAAFQAALRIEAFVQAELEKC